MSRAARSWPSGEKVRRSSGSGASPLMGSSRTLRVQCPVFRFHWHSQGAGFCTSPSSSLEDETPLHESQSAPPISPSHRKEKNR